MKGLNLSKLTQKEREEMKNKAACKLVVFLLAMAMSMSLCTGFSVNAEETDNGISQQEEETGQIKPMQESALRSAPNLSNPRIEKDDSMTAGQKVTWDCVWFGSYPQAEIVPSADDYTAVDKSMLRSGDIIEDSNLYNKLKNASGWDANNDITTDGNKYRRIKKSDATYTSTSPESNYYNWPDSDTWHYFKYEPIKWRVLRVDGNQAFLLSDISLDDQQYNTVNESITWEISTIRSWLNGYDASSNKQGKNYSGKNFIGSAFSSNERSAIVNTSVVNDDNINNGTEGGNNTTDKIFLLSESETYGDSAVAQGFVSSKGTYDAARRSKSSTYAKAMGMYSSYESDAYKGNCMWWLRSPGGGTDFAAIVSHGGDVRNYGNVDHYNGVRAALNLDLSSNLHTYAGTMSSNGEENIPVTGITLTKNKYQMKVGDREQITASVFPESATDKRVDWSSSDNSIAEIDSNGMVTAKASGKCMVQCTAVSDSTISQSAEIEVVAGNNPANNPAGNTGSAKQNQSINTSASTYTKAIGSKAFSLGAKASGDGKLTYTSSNKKVATVSSSGQVSVKSYGAAAITINASATQNYNAATKKVSIKVVPKKASLKAVKSPSKKKVKISWKKDKKVTGYEIYVSPKKDFSRETIKRNYKKNTVSKTISGWKSKRTYYVKIRGYKKIGKAKYYGAWSNAKKVKVK